MAGGQVRRNRRTVTDEILASLVNYAVNQRVQPNSVYADLQGNPPNRRKKSPVHSRTGTTHHKHGH